MGEPTKRQYHHTNMRAGLGHVGAYQVSGRPWITGSTSLDSAEQAKIEFPTIAKSVTVINQSSTGVDLRVHFTDKDVGDTTNGKHYITLTENRDAITMNAKCKEIYITSQADGGKFEVWAELTNIPNTEMYKLTGSGLTEA